MGIPGINTSAGSVHTYQPGTAFTPNWYPPSGLEITIDLYPRALDWAKRFNSAMAPKRASFEAVANQMRELAKDLYPDHTNISNDFGNGRTYSSGTSMTTPWPSTTSPTYITTCADTGASE